MSNLSMAEDPAAPEQQRGPQERDLWLPSIYLAAAAIILAFIIPIHVQFQPRVAESVTAAIVASALLMFATARRMMPLLYASVAVLFVLVLAYVITQPSALSLPVVSVWPLRIMIVLLVGFPWALLMQPGPLLRRALLAVIVPTFAAVLLWGGPALANLVGVRIPVPQRNFAPFWMAMGGQGTLYVTDVRGSVVWVFDSSGSPKGTIRPGRAPAVLTPGPGILPVGIEEEINLAGMGLLPTATPRPNSLDTGGLPAYLTAFEFCGIASDENDNLYVLDMVDPAGYKLLRFNRDGNITARWNLPDEYEPTSYCMATDRDHIYLVSRNNRIYSLSYGGEVEKRIDLDFQPFGIAAEGDGKIAMLSQNMLAHVTVATGEVTSTTLKSPPGQLFSPLLAGSGSDILMVDHNAGQIVRVDSETGDILDRMGGLGTLPGQFAEIGDIVRDQEGLLYVSDWRHRVIERFTAAGQVDAVWWATRNVSVPGLPGDPDAELEGNY